MYIIWYMYALCHQFTRDVLAEASKGIFQRDLSGEFKSCDQRLVFKNTRIFFR